jgi:pyruvate-formate lyase-activating enzyme
MTDATDCLRKVYVEPTNACNLACSICVRHAWEEPEGFMEWEVFEAIVEGMAETGLPEGDQKTIALMGLGEPLLHPGFLDMVQLAKSRDLRVEVTSNALMLDGQLAVALLKAGLDQFVVSIDGASAESFARVRSGASLEHVIENVRHLHDHRGPYYGPRTRIGIEFVAMRSNLTELPGLGRLAAQLGASFVIITNVLPYTPELADETLYDRDVTSYGPPPMTVAPRWELPRFDWDETMGVALGGALRSAGSVSFSGQDPCGVTNQCPFVSVAACAVGWRGNVSPCPPLLHTYTCHIRGREKRMVGWEVGRMPGKTLRGIWDGPAFAEFRGRVRRFDFPPCTDCACEMAEANLEDCFGNPHPVCGDCLWARGVIRCA